MGVGQWGSCPLRMAISWWCKQEGTSQKGCDWKAEVMWKGIGKEDLICIHKLIFHAKLLNIHWRYWAIPWCTSILNIDNICDALILAIFVDWCTGSFNIFVQLLCEDQLVWEGMLWSGRSVARRGWLQSSNQWAPFNVHGFRRLEQEKQVHEMWITSTCKAGNNT